MRSLGEVPLPNASAIRLTSPTTSVAKANAFFFVPGIFYEITGTFYQHGLLNASKIRIIYHTNNENIQETFDEMSGRKWGVGDELQNFLGHLRLQYCAKLAQPSLYLLHHAIECLLRIFPVPFVQLLEKVVLQFPLVPWCQWL
jgi:hypothetical protein